jgi:hypothetical protein
VLPLSSREDDQGNAGDEMDRFTVDEGVVKIAFPPGMIAASVEELEQFFNLFIKRRSAVPEPKTQTDKFKDAAREAGADEDEKHWEERLRKVAQHKGVPPKHTGVGEETENPLPDGDYSDADPDQADTEAAPDGVGDQE